MSGNLVVATLRRGLFTRIIGRRLLYFQEISSTMDEAARQGDAGANEGTVIIAENQTASRGRHGRTWVSNEGNLYMSVLFRPPLKILPMLNMLGGIGAVRAIRACTGSDPRIKWPNDVMLDGKKVSGLLVESVVQGQEVIYAVLGLGINVDLDIESLGDIQNSTTSLNTAVGRPVDRETLLRHLLHDLDGLYQQVTQGVPVMPEWRSMLETLGQSVEAWSDNTYYTGVANDVDEIGNLLLRLDDGKTITLTAGDVSLSNVGQ